jgi:hypothetical protein
MVQGREKEDMSSDITAPSYQRARVTRRGDANNKILDPMNISRRRDDDR